MNNPVWVVKAVEAKEDYTLIITFEGGEKRIYDARPLLEKEIYKELSNIDFFLKARAEYDTVIWNDELDIAPEHLYECSKPISEILK